MGDASRHEVLRVGSSLSVRVGGWFEAQATGWGVLAIPALVLALLVIAIR